MSLLKLPDEILQRIFDEAYQFDQRWHDNRATNARARLLCRSLLPFVDAALFANIRLLYMTNTKDITRIERLTDLLRQNARLRGLCHTVHIFDCWSPFSLHFIHQSGMQSDEEHGRRITSGAMMLEFLAAICHEDSQQSCNLHTLDLNVTLFGLELGRIATFAQKLYMPSVRTVVSQRAALRILPDIIWRCPNLQSLHICKLDKASIAKEAPAGLASFVFRQVIIDTQKSFDMTNQSKKAKCVELLSIDCPSIEMHTLLLGCLDGQLRPAILELSMYATSQDPSYSKLIETLAAPAYCDGLLALRLRCDGPRARAIAERISDDMRNSAVAVSISAAS